MSKDKTPTNVIEQGKKWAEAVDVARSSAQQAPIKSGCTVFTDIAVPSDYVITLDQLANILRNVRAQVSVDYHRQFKSGALATLSIVGARASLQAQQNEALYKSVPATAKAIPAPTKESSTSDTSSNAALAPSYVPRDLRLYDKLANCVTAEEACAVANLHFSSSVSSSSMQQDGTVDWKHAAAMLQQQAVDLQAELYTTSQECITKEIALAKAQARIKQLEAMMPAIAEAKDAFDNCPIV